MQDPSRPVCIGPGINNILVNAMQQAILSYVSEHRPNLKQLYTWKIPDSQPPGVVIPGPHEADLYVRNIELKQSMHAAWRHTDAPQERVELIRWYIAEWGGVKTNRPETIQFYGTASEDEILARKIKGIASWSKGLTVRDPLRFAIFDARTSISLNAIQVIKNVERPTVFPNLPGRNTHVTPAQGAMTRLAKAHGWTKADKAILYKEYCQLLREIAADLTSETGELVTNQMVEMVLFAMADDLSDELCRREQEFLATTVTQPSLK